MVWIGEAVKRHWGTFWGRWSLNRKDRVHHNQLRARLLAPKVD